MRHSTSKGYNNQTNRAIEKFNTDLKSSYCSNKCCNYATVLVHRMGQKNRRLGHHFLCYVYAMKSECPKIITLFLQAVVLLQRPECKWTIK